MWSQKEWRGDERVPLLRGLGNHQVQDGLLKMNLHQGLNWAVLWGPSSAISKVPATLTLPPPLPSPPRSAAIPSTAPHAPPRAQGLDRVPPTAAYGSRPRPRSALQPSAPAAWARLPASAARCGLSRRCL